MSDLFALQGVGNCGKSTTLITLYNAVISKYPSANIQTVHNVTADIAVIIRGIKGLVIGIESQGDPSSRLHKTLAHFAAEKCDIIFCACRTRGMTVGWVNALSPQYNINFIQQKWVTDNYANANNAMSNSLMQQASI